MRLRDILSLAAHNLRESPLRTALCALSVAVGSGALLLILSIGLYGRKQVDVGLQTLGVSGLSVYTESGHAGTILSAALADEIEQDVDGIRTLMPIKAPCASDTQLSTRYFSVQTNGSVKSCKWRC